MTRRDEDPFDELFDMLDEILGSEGFETIDASNHSGQDEPEIHTDTHEYDDKLVFIADLPGVDKDDITIRCDGRTVVIKLDSGRVPGNRFSFELPAKVDPDSATANFQNGVLKTTYQKTGEKDIDL